MAASSSRPLQTVLSGHGHLLPFGDPERRDFVKSGLENCCQSGSNSLVGACWNTATEV